MADGFGGSGAGAGGLLAGLAQGFANTTLQQRQQETLRDRVRTENSAKLLMAAVEAGTLSPDDLDTPENRKTIESAFGKEAAPLLVGIAERSAATAAAERERKASVSEAFKQASGGGGQAAGQPGTAGAAPEFETSFRVSGKGDVSAQVSPTPQAKITGSGERLFRDNFLRRRKELIDSGRSTLEAEVIAADEAQNVPGAIPTERGLKLLEQAPAFQAAIRQAEVDAQAGSQAAAQGGFRAAPASAAIDASVAQLEQPRSGETAKQFSARRAAATKTKVALDTPILNAKELSLWRNPETGNPPDRPMSPRALMDQGFVQVAPDAAQAVSSIGKTTNLVTKMAQVFDGEFQGKGLLDVHGYGL